MTGGWIRFGCDACLYSTVPTQDREPLHPKCPVCGSPWVGREWHRSDVLTNQPTGDRSECEAKIRQRIQEARRAANR